MDKIIKLRSRIDQIDSDIMRLLNERYEISDEIGTIKSSSKVDVLDTKREEYVLNKTKKHSHSPQLELVYRTIMHESKNIQRR
jgi:chorismate mutase